jgi:hypothetical protein
MSDDERAAYLAGYEDAEREFTQRRATQAPIERAEHESGTQVNDASRAERRVRELEALFVAEQAAARRNIAESAPDMLVPRAVTRANGFLHTDEAVFVDASFVKAVASCAQHDVTSTYGNGVWPTVADYMRAARDVLRTIAVEEAPTDARVRDLERALDEHSRLAQAEAQPAAVGVMGHVRWGRMYTQAGSANQLMMGTFANRDDAEKPTSVPYRVVAIVDPAQIVPLASAEVGCWKVGDGDNIEFWRSGIAGGVPHYPGIAQPAQEREE